MVTYGQQEACLPAHRVAACLFFGVSRAHFAGVPAAAAAGCETAAGVANPPKPVAAGAAAGVAAAAPKAGALAAAPNAGVLAAAPKAGVLAGAPNAGVLACPNAGAVDAPNAGVLAAPKAGVLEAPMAGVAAGRRRGHCQARQARTTLCASQERPLPLPSRSFLLISISPPSGTTSAAFSGRAASVQFGAAHANDVTRLLTCAEARRSARRRSEIERHPCPSAGAPPHPTGTSGCEWRAVCARQGLAFSRPSVPARVDRQADTASLWAGAQAGESGPARPFLWSSAPRGARQRGSWSPSCRRRCVRSADSRGSPKFPLSPPAAAVLAQSLNHG